ncbi:MAG: cyclic pyranopterin monophosphate synthase MoaC [Nitrospirota bacterium]|nr:cyclic pyranopterin monophosphate synthase MoaC [Nitrospirota bacterium]
MSDLTHFNDSGRAHMVDVSGKADTSREAIAAGTIKVLPATFERIQNGKIAKGDVLSVAQVAGIMAAKKCHDIIPMCHPLLLTKVNIEFVEDSKVDADGYCSITATGTVRVKGQTGVEMEALTAVSVTLLTIYDMCKAIDKGMYFTNVGLLSKEGGKSGDFTNPHIEAMHTNVKV